MGKSRSRRVLSFTITLRHIVPPIWRTILVSDSAKLTELHEAIQGAFGWQDYHLHEFVIDGRRFSDPASDEWGMDDAEDDSIARLYDFGLSPGDAFLYRYDFGDDWEHEVVVVETREIKRGERLPRCTAGARSAPPEDVGGPPGYAQFLHAIADPEDEEHDTYLQWVGGDFDPERFNLERANDVLGAGRQGNWASARTAPRSPAMQRPPVIEGELAAPPPSVLQNTDVVDDCRGLAVRGDVVALITYVRDNRVTGTTSTGNFPRKSVEAIGSRFADPPELGFSIGDVFQPFRTEDEVWPVYFAHALANAAGLIEGGPGRRWNITPTGAAFLTRDPLRQVWALAATWWSRMDWTIGGPSIVDDAPLPETFEPAVLAVLRESDVGAEVPFGFISDRILNGTGWTRSDAGQLRIWDALTAVVELCVVAPLETLGLLRVQRKSVRTPWGERTEPAFVSVTPFGAAFVGSLA